MSKPVDAGSATGSKYLASLIHKSQNLKCVGQIFNLPVMSILLDATVLEGGTLQRAIHSESITDRSIRETGFDYNSGYVKLYERAHTTDSWRALKEANEVPDGEVIPILLKDMTWATPEEGQHAAITCPWLKWRIFLIIDGAHRSKSMQKMLKEGHRFAEEFFKRGVLLMNTTEAEMKEVTLCSMMTNNMGGKRDADFITDKIRQALEVVKIY